MSKQKKNLSIFEEVAQLHVEVRGLREWKAQYETLVHDPQGMILSFLQRAEAAEQRCAELVKALRTIENATLSPRIAAMANAALAAASPACAVAGKDAPTTRAPDTGETK